MATFTQALQKAREKAQQLAGSFVQSQKDFYNKQAAEGQRNRQALGNFAKTVATGAGQAVGNLAGLQTAGGDPGYGTTVKPGASLPTTVQRAIRQGPTNTITQNLPNDRRQVFQGRDLLDAAQLAPGSLNNVVESAATRFLPKAAPIVRSAAIGATQGAIESQLPQQSRQERLPNLVGGTVFGGVVGGAVAGLERANGALFPEGGQPIRFSQPQAEPQMAAFGLQDIPFISGKRKLPESVMEGAQEVGTRYLKQADGSYMRVRPGEELQASVEPSYGQGKYRIEYTSNFDAMPTPQEKFPPNAKVLAAQEEATGIKIGQQVKAGDRGNFGKVVGINPDGTATVAFRNKSTNTSKTVDLPITSLSDANGFKLSAKQNTAQEIERAIGIRQGLEVPGGKERGFIRNVKNNPNTAPEVAAGVKGSYNPRSTDQLAMKARTLVKEDIGTAKDVIRTQTDENAVAVASELIKHYQDAGDFDSAVAVANEIAPKLTELGRGVQAASIYGRITPEGILRFAQSEIVKARTANPRLKLPDMTAQQAEKFLAQAKKIQGMADGRDKALAVQKLTESIQDLVPSTFGQKAISLWKAGLLTGAKTTGTNLASNTVNATAEAIKDVPAAIVDSMASLFTKKRTVVGPNVGEAGATIKGVKEGAAKGFDYLKSGYDERNIAGKFDYKRVNFGTSKTAKALQAYEETIFRAIGSQDQPFFYGAKARSLYNQGQAVAKTQGLKGTAAKEFIDNFVSKPSDDALKLAVQDAEIATFQNSTKLGDIGSAVGQKGGALGQFVVPFSKTPAAAAMQGLVNYTPVGAVKTVIENAGKGKFDQRAFSQGLGRSITGTGVLAIGGALASAGLITTAQPSSETERKQWELEGKKPNSILIDGKWRSTNVLGPAGLLLVQGATYQNTLKETGSTSQALTAAAAGGGRALTDSTFLTGVSNITNALEDPARFGPRYAQSAAGSVIPTVVADTAQAFDPYKRETNSIGDAVQNRIPGLRNSNIVQRDILGQPLQRDNAIQSFLDPSRPSPVRTGVITNELSRLNIAGEKTTPSGLDKSQTINKKKVVLNPNQLNKLEIAVGEQIRPALETVISDPGYGSLSDSQKKKILSQVVEDVRATEKIRVSYREGLVSAEDAAAAISKLEKGQKELLINNKLRIAKPKPEKKSETTQEQINATQQLLQGDNASDPLSQGIIGRAMAANDPSNSKISVSLFDDGPSDEKSLETAKFSLDKDRLKRANDYSGYAQAAQDQIDFLENYRDSLSTDDAEYYSVSNTIEDLQADLAKGGFRAGKKPVTLANGSSISRDAYNDQKKNFTLADSTFKLEGDRIKRENNSPLYLQLMGEQYASLEQRKSIARSQAELNNIINKQEDLVAQAQEIRKNGGLKKVNRPSLAAPAKNKPEGVVRKPSTPPRRVRQRRKKVAIHRPRSK